MTTSSTAAGAPAAFGTSLPPGEERDNLERARRYLAAIEKGDPVEGALQFLAPNVSQIEYPNQFLPKGAERNLAAIAEAAEHARRKGRSGATGAPRSASGRRRRRPLSGVLPWAGQPATNHWAWFHVAEDELNHRGQIRWLRARRVSSAGELRGENERS